MKTIHDFPEVAAQAQRLEKLRAAIKDREHSLREVLRELEAGRPADELEAGRALLVEAVLAGEEYSDESARRRQLLQERHAQLLDELRALKAAMPVETSALGKATGEASASFLPTLKPEYVQKWKAFLRALAEAEALRDDLFVLDDEARRAGFVAFSTHVGPVPYAVTGGTEPQARLAAERGLITKGEQAELLALARVPAPDKPEHTPSGFHDPGPIPVPGHALHGPSVGRLIDGADGGY